MAHIRQALSNFQPLHLIDIYDRLGRIDATTQYLSACVCRDLCARIICAKQTLLIVQLQVGLILSLLQYNHLKSLLKLISLLHLECSSRSRVHPSTSWRIETATEPPCSSWALYWFNWNLCLRLLSWTMRKKWQLKYEPAMLCFAIRGRLQWTLNK